MGAYTSSLLASYTGPGATAKPSNDFLVTLAPREDLPVSIGVLKPKQQKIEVEKIEVIHAVAKDWRVGSFGSFFSKLKQRHLSSESADVWAFKVSDYETRLAQALKESIPDKPHPRCINMLSVEHDKNNAVVYAVRERQDGYLLDVITAPGQELSEAIVVRQVVEPLLAIVADFYSNSLEVTRRGTADWIKPSSLGYTIIDTPTRRHTLIQSTVHIHNMYLTRNVPATNAAPFSFVDLPTEILYAFAQSYLHLPDAAKLAMVSKTACVAVHSLMGASERNFAARPPTLRLVNCIMQDYVGYQLRGVNPSCDFTMTPEVLAYGFSDQSYDMFCIASIAHILLCGQVHYHACAPDQCQCSVHMLFDKLTNVNRETNFDIPTKPLVSGTQVRSSNSEPATQHLSRECVDFLSKCLVLKTIPTLTAAKALKEHPWITGAASKTSIPPSIAAKAREYWQGFRRAWVDKETPSFVPIGGPSGYVQNGNH